MPRMSSGAFRSPLAILPAPALVIAGVLGFQGGAVIAVGLIPSVGIVGAVTLRLGFGAVGLLALARPRLRSLALKNIPLMVLVGAILAVHHLCFYEAVHRLPLGVAVTLEFIGPLTVALVGSRSRTDLLWAVLAGVGVAAAAGVSTSDHVSVPGVLCGLGAGACWAGFIIVFPILSRRAGRSDGLALATLCGALLVVPFGLATDYSRILVVRYLLLGASVALLADVIAFTLQSEALNRIPGRLFSILTSTEPVVGALFGLLALGQEITWEQWAGILAVAAASVSATRSHRLQPTEGPGPGGRQHGEKAPPRDGNELTNQED
jgi:inner membrane transporter RhtA